MWVISALAWALKTGINCLPRLRVPMIARRMRSFGFSAARVYVAAESVSAETVADVRNSRRVAGIGGFQRRERKSGMLYSMRVIAWQDHEEISYLPPIDL